MNIEFENKALKDLYRTGNKADKMYKRPSLQKFSR